MKLIYQTAILRQAQACRKRPIKDLIDGSDDRCLCWCYRANTGDFLLYDRVYVAELLSLFPSHQTIFLCADHQGALYQRICVSAQSHAPQWCQCFLSSVSFYSSFISSASTLLFLSPPAAPDSHPSLLGTFHIAAPMLHSDGATFKPHLVRIALWSNSIKLCSFLSSVSMVIP